MITIDSEVTWTVGDTHLGIVLHSDWGRSVIEVDLDDFEIYVRAEELNRWSIFVNEWGNITELVQPIIPYENVLSDVLDQDIIIDYLKTHYNTIQCHESN